MGLQYYVDNSGNVYTEGEVRSNTWLKSDYVVEATASAGVNVDSVLIKDGTISPSATTNQIVLGTTNTTTLSATAPSSSLTYTIADLGASGKIALTTNTDSTIKTGTWTPTMGDATNNFTLTKDAGFYSKIGDTVFITAYITWSSKGSATGQVNIKSLPFTSANITDYRGNIRFDYTDGLVFTNGALHVFPGASIGQNATLATVVINANDGSSPTPLLASSCDATGLVLISGFYRSA